MRKWSNYCWARRPTPTRKLESMATSRVQHRSELLLGEDTDSKVQSGYAASLQDHEKVVELLLCKI